MTGAKNFLRITFLFSCVFIIETPAIASESNERPANIILILADDLGINDTGIYGSEVIKTPNIDNLARGGIRFSQAYVSHPVCSPSRAGLMTGQYQQRHGWEFNPARRDRETGMNTGVRTIAESQKSFGYATGMVGKWHLGHKRPNHPLNRGFDEYFGVLDGATSYINSEVPGTEHGSLRGEPAPTIRLNQIVRGFDEITVDEYLTDVFTDEAAAYIENHKEAPFFLYLSHITPHTPLQATKKYLDRYRHIEDVHSRVYAAMVSSLDDSVGEVVNTLKSTGQYENTLIVFMSDNGCAGYIQNACSNAPYAGYKRYHQEGGIRTPLIFSWPAGLSSGEIYEYPVITLDLMATFAAVSGQQIDSKDSVNLLPYLKGRLKKAPHDYLFWRSGPTIAVRDDRWKLIRYNKTDFTTADLDNTGRLTAPENGWTTESPMGQVTLLYDLHNDPGETANLAKTHAEIVARLAARHSGWANELQKGAILPAIRSTLAEMHGEPVQLIF